MEGLVREANGDLINALLLYKMRFNNDNNYVNRHQDQALAVEMANHAAREIPLPGK